MNRCSVELPLFNCSDAVSIVPEPNLWCLLLVLFPITCVFGNSLVVLAVLKERCLQTSTNYLLVSLAAADMLVALLVMPFSVYLTVNRLYWFLPMSICDFFCVIDVSASTASIVHLVAISVDRFYAVVKHMEYKTSRHKTRVNCTIFFCWVFSAAIGLPLGIGLNHGETSVEEGRCGIVNPNYMLYSSIFAFYIPCLVMIVMYSFVFYRLHKRMLAVRLQEMAAGKMVNFGDNLGNILQNVYSSKSGKNTLTWALPFLKSIEQALANMVENDDVSLEELDELTMILQTLQMSKAKSTKGTRSPYDIPLDGLAGKKSLTESLHIGRKLKLRPFRSKSFTVFFAKSKIGTLKDRAIELLMRMKSRQGIVIRKEARATKLVATVMLIFLLCYMPFFTMNIVKVFKLMNGSWTNDMEEMFIVFTWFGYVNSCLNPAIYSLFNRKFRIAFKKLLCCQNNANDAKRNSSRKFVTGTMLPTSYSPTNEQPTTYNFDIQLKRLTNTVERKFNRRLNIRAANQTSLPLLPEGVSVHTMPNSNSAEKISESIRNAKYALDAYKLNTGKSEENGNVKIVENDLHMSNRSVTVSTNNASDFDDEYVDLANVKINYFFTEAVEV